MTSSAIDLATGLARATIYVSISALLVRALLSKLRVLSPRLHRVAWCIVVLQGWLFLPPWTLQIPVGEKQPVTVVSDADTVVPRRGSVLPPESPLTPSPNGESTTKVLAHDNAAAAARSMWISALTAIFWIGGLVSLVAYYGLMYLRFVRRVPVGQRPSGGWASEWNDSLKESRVRRGIQLRVTKDLGPLLCFLPFCHFVLTPRQLWQALHRLERLAVLRHELAHFLRGDIWKSAAIRVLALPQWFNPLVWWAIRRFDECGEWACDDLARGADSQQNVSYAKTLLRLGETNLNVSAYSVAAHGGLLTTRVKRVLSPTFKEDPMMKRFVLFAILCPLLTAQLVRVELVAEETATVTDGQVYHEVYNVADLIVPADKEGSDADFDSLIDGITSTVAPATWHQNGGGGSIAKFETNRALVVGQTESVHTKIAEFLKSKRRQSDLRRVGLVPYRIEPPDILLIQPVRSVPKEPYDIQGLDILQIVAAGTRLEPPIAGRFQVKADGVVSLGRTYGDVEVAGLSISEAADAVKRHLEQRELSVSDVAVSLLQASGVRLIAGEHLVGPDGHVNLGDYGTVYVAGTTIKVAKAAIERNLSETFDEPEVSLDVSAVNSKVCYAIIQTSGLNDRVVCLPCVGKETVIDAIAVIQTSENLTAVSKVWIGRHEPREASTQILPVDWAAITNGGSTATNYQLLPGDRVYVRTGKSVLGKVRPANTASAEPPEQLISSDCARTAKDGPSAAESVEPVPSATSESRPASSGSSTPRIGDDRKEDDEPQAKANQWIEITGPVVAGFDQPDPDIQEIRQAIIAQRPGLKNRFAGAKAAMEGIGDLVDPPRRYPLVGFAQLRHRLFRYVLADDGVSNQDPRVYYLDYRCLVRLEESGGATPKEAETRIGLEGYCPVTLQEQLKWQRGDPSLFAAHEGVRYVFTAIGQRDKFVANPQLYAPAQRGLDIVAFVEGKRESPGKRMHGVLFRNRLFLFASEANLQRFWEDPEHWLASDGTVEPSSDLR